MVIMTREEIKAKSKNDLGGELFGNKWLSAVLVVFIFSMLTSFGSVSNNEDYQVTLPPSMVQIFNIIIIVSAVIGTILWLVFLPLQYGAAKNFLNVTRGEKSQVGTLFHGYKENLKQNFLSAFMTNLYISLWSLLFVIPGLVKMYSYAMTQYIRNEYPTTTWQEAITRSREMMDGYKMQLFLLDLSFIGWYIVGALCLGVGTLWVSAYHLTARANFFNEISGYNYRVKKAMEEEQLKAQIAPTEEI